MHFFHRISLLLFGFANLFWLKWVFDTLLSQQISDFKTVPTGRSITVDTFLHVQQLRKLRLKSFCGERPQAKRMHLSHLTRLVINNKYELIYCDVPGIGIDSWKQLLKILEHQDEITLDTPVLNAHIVAPHKNLSSYNLTMTGKLLHSYTKILFVRNPFQRLVSFYNRFSRYHINFTEFVQHILDMGLKYSDVNWKPLVSLCQPCRIKYDYIIMYGFLSHEVHYMMSRLGVHGKISFPTFEDTEFHWIYKWMTKQYFSETSDEQKKQLLQYYHADLLAFPFLDFPWD